MSTGNGVNAVLAASVAAHVVAVDINPVAVVAATESARGNGIALDRFFAQARDHLSDDGRMLTAFGNSGDIGYLHQLVAATNSDPR